VEKAAIVDLLAPVPVARWLYGQRGGEAEFESTHEAKFPLPLSPYQSTILQGEIAH